ncbi:hypothetical protein EPA93_07760 [Ktedonosporobacter rubrisoli]|uniref:VOC domain-containing protein n=1 Tax=Ktedonosporobacter rubrisoli TaxID=2509675 RepID=A0A4P6JLK7_KTERU|nr:hypothetical protein [Ktedonosporobacter rubrisoli]QBD75910.1 hypothetical protein EPA93_07760 [Ktedonosporobacter rubrisoli]
MKFVELTLATTELAAQRNFYTSHLSLPLLAETEQSFTVLVGQSKLTFQATTQPDVNYHFAFNIPSNQFAQAKQWLQERVTLLKEGDKDEFNSSFWPGHQIYFRDAANNILELIAPEELPSEAEGLFGSQSLLNISEIGLPVPNVLESAAFLEDHFVHNRFHGRGSATFAPVGDLISRCIVVKIGHHWLPTNTAAVVAPVHAILQGNIQQRFRVADLPYSFEISPASQAGPD